ncbi:hypothetical protein BH09ACT5_BH09ACT5_15890 [soil metagenome]
MSQGPRPVMLVIITLAAIAAGILIARLAGVGV